MNFFEKIIKRILFPDICWNKKHYGAKIISFDPEESRCTICGKKVLKGNYK